MNEQPGKISTSEAIIIAQLKEELVQAHAEIKNLKQAQIDEKQKREQIESDLRHSQQMLQLVMDTLPESIFWKDRDSVYLGCNQNFAGSPKAVRMSCSDEQKAR